MTCLIPLLNLANAQTCASFQRLLDRWTALGLDPAVFQPGERAGERLATWSIPELEELQALLDALTSDPDACRTFASDFGLLAPHLGRPLVLLRPLLSLEGLTRAAAPMAFHWPRLEGDILTIPLERLGLPPRTANLLRRHRCFGLVDLAGLTPARVLALRGVGKLGLYDVHNLLEEHGLPLPFSLEEAFTLPPLPAAPVPAVPVVAPPCLSPQPAAQDLQACREWGDRAAEILASVDRGQQAESLLQDLQALTVERFPSLTTRLEEIHQMRVLVRMVQDAATAITASASLRCVIVAMVQQRLLKSYSARLAAGGQLDGWLSKLQRLFLPADAPLLDLLQRLAGMTLQQVAAERRPALTREGIRQRIQRLENLLGFQSLELATMCRQSDESQGRSLRDAQLRQWISSHGRLIFPTDEIGAVADGDLRFALEAVEGCSLSGRLSLYAELGLEVPRAEWDLHFRLLVNREQRPGRAYWHTLEPLRHFLPRFAELLGAPALMPHQVDLPPAVRAAVQRHGGQGKVARTLGLTYQGQLVGGYGRIYWSELRLQVLLEQTVRWCGLPERAMPSRLQIRDFMASGLVAEYTDKRCESVISALTRAFSLSWEQTAARFGRS